MGPRRAGRVIAFQSLYRYEYTGESLAQLLEFNWLEAQEADADGLPRTEPEALDFARLLIAGTLENIAEVDAAIKRQLEHWDFSRLARVDLAILRLSVYCLLRQPSIPHSVTIDEAVDIAKEYSGEDSYRFVNGVLDAIRKRTTA